MCQVLCEALGTHPGQERRKSRHSSGPPYALLRLLSLSIQFVRLATSCVQSSIVFLTAVSYSLV